MKPGRDADGDIVPRSALLSSYSARQWDKYKKEKYNQKPKAAAVYKPEWVAPVEPEKKSFFESLKNFFKFR